MWEGASVGGVRVLEGVSAGGCKYGRGECGRGVSVGRWLIDSFCPEILVRWWRTTKAFCSSVSVHVVVVLFAGGGDI